MTVSLCLLACQFSTAINIITFDTSMMCFKIKVSYFTPAVSNDVLTNKSTGLCFYLLISNSENLNRPKRMQINYSFS